MNGIDVQQLDEEPHQWVVMVQRASGYSDFVHEDQTRIGTVLRAVVTFQRSVAR